MDKQTGRVGEVKKRRSVTNLLAVLELPHHAIVIPFGHALRIANGALDERLETTLEELVHLVVIVIVVPDAEHALYVVPDRSSETGRVHLAVRAHGVVGEVVGYLELVVEQVPDVVVEAVHQRVTVVVPGVVLHAERRYVVQLTALKREPAGEHTRGTVFSFLFVPEFERVVV